MRNDTLTERRERTPAVVAPEEVQRGACRHESGAGAATGGGADGLMGDVRPDQSDGVEVVQVGQGGWVQQGSSPTPSES